MIGQRVLIVDVDPVAREVLAARLRMQGCIVVEASDPAHGAHLALSHPPAAVIADLWMPRISGVQLCRLLRAEASTAHIPVLLRGPDGPRNRFWAERAGAAGYVAKGRMGELVRALTRALDSVPETAEFFTELSAEGPDIRDRIACHLDEALFESVIASEVRALGLAGAADRVFDLLSQFVSQVTTYRWLALTIHERKVLAIHANPRGRARAEDEARRALGVGDDVDVLRVEDEDAIEGEAPGAVTLVIPVKFGDQVTARLAASFSGESDRKDAALLELVARELGGPLRIATLVEESKRLANVDPLTGLLNRRAFLAALDGEARECATRGRPFAVALLDIDHFKSINDRCGHAGGDQVLVAVARALTAQIRAGDLLSRWGGEELLMVLSGAGEGDLPAIGERLRAAVEGLRLTDAKAAPVHVTISVGLAVKAPHETTDEAIGRADAAMYLAKAGGRNRVVIDPSSRVAQDRIPRVPLVGAAE